MSSAHTRILAGHLRTVPIATAATVRRCFSSVSIPEFTNPQAVSLLNRKLPVIRDFISPQNTHLLDVSLSPYLQTSVSTEHPQVSGEIAPGHYLVYFPPQNLESSLLFDGADAEQSPGDEWTRRMWAGGSVHFNEHKKLKIFDRGVLKERVASVEMKGQPGSKDEKMFVWFERKIWAEPLRGQNGEWLAEKEVETIEGQEAVIERRCLVFMKERTEKAQTPRIVKPPHPAEFYLQFTPTQHLLFRFSALTFNAHKIHFDTEFSRNGEGYPANLCHGPLSQVFLLELLRLNVIDKLGGKKRVKQFDYRNLAPMYVGEPYKICGRQQSENTYELWVETPAGGYSVKGVATLESA
ncbi:hypothetical protein RUND412_008898 [Rhizina undulata]